MAGISGLYSTLPKYTSSNVVALLMNAIKTESDPTNQQMMMWLLTVAIQQEASYWANGLASSRNSQVPITVLLICTIVGKSSRYKPQVLYTAFDCLRHLSLVCEELFVHASSSVVHLVNTCCDFITNSAPILRSSRAPFYLDSLMASAYHCIIEWIVAAPLLLAKPQVIAKIVTTVVDGNDRIQSFTSKNTAVAVREAAQKLVNMLMKHHVAQTTTGMNARSSMLTEKVGRWLLCLLLSSRALASCTRLTLDVDRLSPLCVCVSGPIQSALTDICGKTDPNVHSHCRFFAVNKSSILTVMEKPESALGQGEAILIMRDSTGRYAWRSRPRFRDGPRPKTLEEYEAYVESGTAASDTEEVESDDNDDTERADSDDDSEKEEEERPRDPLLSAIRDTQSKTTMMSWKAVAQQPGDAAGGLRTASNQLQTGEGNTGMSSLTERRAMAAGRDEGRETQDAIFTNLLAYQRHEELSSRVVGSAGSGERCVKPGLPVKDPHLQSWETARRVLTELGFLSVRNWGNVFAMDASGGQLLRDLEALDKLPDQETFEVAVAYATSLGSKGGYDRVQLVTSADVRAGTVTLSPDYQLFLSALGQRVDVATHTGYAGSLNTAHTNGKILYHSHYNHEACFYVPTLPLEARGDDEADSAQTALTLLERSNVMILWNECQQKYRPGSVLWDRAFGLSTPTSRVVLIIDPLENDLYCVHISHESSPLFTTRDVITNEEDNCVDDGDVYCARVLGPLQDGMVVNGAWLAPLVRQTALNAAMLSRAYHRYQYEVGAVATTPVGPEVKRAEVIAAVVEKHMRPKLPGDFYGGLFADIAHESSSSA